MGCDIHAHFEIKVNGKWVSYSQPILQRHYNIFAKIAGVRNYNEIKPISEPKGLPDDISELVKLHSDLWQGSSHSHTWLNADEIKEMVEFGNEAHEGGWKGEWEHLQLGYLFGNGWDGWKEYRDSYPDFVEDIRFVCWFDN